MKHLNQERLGCAEFVSKEDGAGTVFSLLIFVSLVALGGIAVDVTNVTMARTQLQVTADAVAHAALVSRSDGMLPAEAKAVGLSIASANMTAANYGVVVRPEEIVYGRWIGGTNGYFQEGPPDSSDAVRVVARQDTTNANPLATFMLRIIGFDQWDVSVVSVFATDNPSCLREGYIANGRIDIQSGNTYSDGFCIHSNSYVKMSSGNTFEDTDITVVSMPEWEINLDIPASGMESNTGLIDVVASDEYPIRILERINVVIDAIRNPASDQHPSYLSDTVQPDVALPQRVTRASDLRSGRVHTRTCSGNGGGALALEVDVVGVAIITNCRVSLGQNVNVINSVIVSTNDSDTPGAIEGAAGVTLGAQDNCLPGGEAQLIASRGSIKFSSDLGIFGSQMIALNNVTFSARGTGIEGASIIAGGTIDQTSGARMGFCNNGTNSNNFEADYFKLRQ